MRKPPSEVLVGGSGGEKTFNLNRLHLSAVLEGGQAFEIVEEGKKQAMQRRRRRGLA